MKHNRVKFTSEHEDGEIPKGWHLVSNSGIDDGEYTACGLAIPEYEYNMELKPEGGGITCAECLQLIRYYKKIKL